MINLYSLQHKRRSYNVIPPSCRIFIWNINKSRFVVIIHSFLFFFFDWTCTDIFCSEDGKEQRGAREDTRQCIVSTQVRRRWWNVMLKKSKQLTDGGNFLKDNKGLEPTSAGHPQNKSKISEPSTPERGNQRTDASCFDECVAKVQLNSVANSAPYCRILPPHFR